MNEDPQTDPGRQRGRSDRRLRNFLLMPRIQIRLGAYMVALALAFMVALVGSVYIRMGEIMALIVQLTDVEDEVKGLLISYVNGMAWWMALAIMVYIASNLCLSILYTHKMVGPTYAFRRHIRSLEKGEFHVKTRLRKSDAFEELAGDLNDLSDALEAKYGPRVGTAGDDNNASSGPA